MDIVKILNDVNQRKESIDIKYFDLMGKLDCLRKELSDIPIKYSSRTKQFQKEKQNLLEEKISKMCFEIDKWKQDQLKKLDIWLTNQRNKILNDAEELNNDINNSRKVFKPISDENNIN